MTDGHELQRQRDCYRAAYESALRELDAIKAAARCYLERQFWRGNGERLAALCGYQHPCEPEANDDTTLDKLAQAVNEGRAWVED